jgi:lysophospholipase L1-like esterase
MGSFVRLSARGFALGALVVCLVEFWTTPAVGAAPSAPAGNAAESAGWYLALGDSIPFGTAPANTPFAPAYPELVGQTLDLSVQNASCPGETTQHFISTSGQDLLCGLFRLFAPLHTWYLGSQLDYARFFLWLAGSSTRLVTVQVGVNNFHVLRAQCWFNDSCVDAHIAATLTQMAADEDTILKALRSSGYTGKMVVIGYYSTGPAGSTESLRIQALNAALAKVAAANGTGLVDAYALFNGASPGGDACAAGLLARNLDGSCDWHPSAKGHALLASSIFSQVRAPATHCLPGACSSTASRGHP